MGTEVGLDGAVSEVARGENVRDVGAEEGGGVAGFGEVDLGKAAVLAGEFSEGVEGFDDAGALGPTGADAGGVGEDGAFAAAEGGFAGGTEGGGRGVGVEEVSGGDVLDAGRGGEAVHREADAASAEIGADLLVLGAVETVLGEEGIE